MPVQRPGESLVKSEVYIDNSTTPVNAPEHVTPSAEPLIGNKGDRYTDTSGILYIHDGTAYRAVPAAGAAAVAAGLNFKRQVTDTGGVYATPIVLTEAQSGRVILVDDAAGLDFTLPAVAAAQVGTWYEFLVTVTITSNNLRVTAATGDLLRGAVSIQDFDTANTIAYFTPDESDDLIFAANGSTKGGKKGSRVRFIAIHATGWFVEGQLYGDGALATPFA